MPEQALSEHMLPANTIKSPVTNFPLLCARVIMLVIIVNQFDCYQSEVIWRWFGDFWECRGIGECKQKLCNTAQSAGNTAQSAVNTNHRDTNL